MAISGIFKCRHRGDDYYTFTEVLNGWDVKQWYEPIKRKVRRGHQLKLIFPKFKRLLSKNPKIHKVPTSPLALRFRVLVRDNFQCHYCGRGVDEVILEIDHVIPISKGGVNSIDNYVAACHECNIGKRDSLLLVKVDGKWKNKEIYLGTRKPRE